MKSRIADIDWIHDLYATPDPSAEPTRDCPDLDRLRAAAAAELPLDERHELLDHALGCRYCSESWRLALRLGARPPIPFWLHFLGVLRMDMRRLANLPRRLRHSAPGRGIARFLEARGPHSGGWQLVTLSAVFATALAVASFLWPRPETTDSGIRRGGPAELRGGESAPPPAARVAAGIPANYGLPREEFVLRWSAPPDATHFDVRVETPEGEVVDSAAALTVPRFRISEDKLRPFRSGTTLTWSLMFYLQDGRRAEATGLRVRVE